MYSYLCVKHICVKLNYNFAVDAVDVKVYFSDKGTIVIPLGNAMSIYQLYNNDSIRYNGISFHLLI